MNEQSNTVHYLGFSLIPGIGRVRLTMLEKYFGDLSTAWKANEAELSKVGLDCGTINSIVYWRSKVEPARELEKADRFGVSVVTAVSPKYPSRLKEIYDYPPVLYIKGNLLPEDQLSIAVVGTRNPTAYGRQVTEEIVTALSRNNVTIASGLARGIDTISHSSALKAGGRTIGVLGSGVNVIYPPENTAIAKQIIENGALISEYAMDMGPRPENFPRRNRILSGLTLGTLVTEAGEKSGALITAEYALDQNRDVFAIPGNIFSAKSSGTNRLIQQGAKLVRTESDILIELNIESVATQLEFKETLPVTENEKNLIRYLGVEPVHIDEICRTSKLPASVVSSTLSMMELKGTVKHLGGMNYTLSRVIKES
ncbi:DNA-processing protein DprA [Dehalogenimonas alkenigignens]|nr:DNA-processing protein DprA [Dehalogenimonas alkenigignens]